jgi:hypothetical protein
MSVNVSPRSLVSSLARAVRRDPLGHDVRRIGDWATRRLRSERVVRGAVPISRRSQRFGASSAGLPRRERNRLGPTILQRVLSTR